MKNELNSRLTGSNKPKTYGRIETKRMSESTPRVLNVYFGEHTEDKLPAVNYKVSDSPAALLPFESRYFVVVRITIPVDLNRGAGLYAIIAECRRVLHHEGELHIRTPEKTNDSSLIEKLAVSGFNDIVERSASQDLAYVCDIVNPSLDRYNLLIARMKKTPHSHDTVLSEKEFNAKCRKFVSKYKSKVPSSYIVPVYNEAKNLPAFLAFLENSANNTKTEREYIFVLNGCTDDSEQIILDFTRGTYLNTKVIYSGLGIVTAYIEGINNRELNGFIGKLDADVILHPHLLDLLQMHLVENDQIQVAYAEPMPVDSVCEYNITDHHPELMTKRLYYTSKTSLNRLDPFSVPAVKRILEGFRAEDMFMSFYFIYFYGIESISRTPHAHVYAKTVHTYDDLVKQISRMNSEMEREFKAYPAFRILSNITEQNFYPSPYKDTFESALKDSKYVDEWTRIQSTK